MGLFHIDVTHMCMCCVVVWLVMEFVVNFMLSMFHAVNRLYSI